MLLIFEGIDCSGKTTAANSIANALVATGQTVTQLHKSAPKSQDILEEYTRELFDYSPGRGHHLICDRWHLGEIIYGPLYRGSTDLTAEGITTIEKMLQGLGAIVIHMDHDHKTIEKRFAERGEDFMKPSDIKKVLLTYRDVMTRVTRLPVVTACDPQGATLASIMNAGRLMELSALTKRRMIFE